MRMASCGRATRFCEIRTVDDGGDDMAPGDVGEIIVRGNFVMDRYLDDEAATSARGSAAGTAPATSARSIRRGTSRSSVASRK